MFSSPGPSRRLHPPKQGAHLSGTFREPRQSALSASPSASPAPQPESKLHVQHRSRVLQTRNGVYSSTPEYTVSLLSSYPHELQTALASSNNDQYRGLVDASTRFSLLSFRGSTYAWGYSPSSKSSSSLYIFQNPASKPSLPEPLACFVPYKSSQEPGLILCSVTGAVSYWDTVLLGLTGADSTSARTIQLTLSPDERILNMARLEPSVYILSTSAGKLFRLVISSAGAKRTVHASVVSDNRSLLHRMTSTLFTSVIPSQHTRQMAISCEARSDNRTGIMWTATSSRLQRWVLSSDTWDELSYDQPLDQLLAASLPREASDHATSWGDLQIEAHDIVARDDQAVILVSSASGGRGGTHRVFSLAQLAWRDSSLIVVHTWRLPDRLSAEVRPPSLQVIEGSPSIALLTFGDKLVMQALLPGDAFQNVLRLRQPWNQLLSTDGSSSGSTSTFILQTLDDGLLMCQLDQDKARHAGVEVSSHRVQSLMEQEIFFGSNPQNPFLFQLERRNDGSTGMAAERLSHDILTSQSEFLPPALDLGNHLDERSRALSHLFTFINNSNVYDTLSEETKQRLLFDRNRVVVGAELWREFNDPNTLLATRQVSMLTHAIENIMQTLGKDGDDMVREFFRTELHHLELLFEELNRFLENASPYGDPSLRLADVLACTNIVLLLLETSETHRLAYVERHRMLNVLVPLWGAGDAHLRLTSALLNALVSGLQAFAKGQIPFSALSKIEIEERLHDLAEMILTLWVLAHDFVQSESDPERKRLDLASFEPRFTAARVQVLHALVQWGGIAKAYRLAEDYLEYGFLVELSADPVSGDPEKVLYYLRKYRGSFAQHFFKWCLENGQAAKMMQLPVEFLPLAEAFFRGEEHPRLQWIGDTAKPVSKFSSAQIVLDRGARSEPKFNTKKVLLSLSKLNAIAAMTQDIEPVADVDRELDLISVQELLSADLRHALGDQALDALDRSNESLARCLALSFQHEPAILSLFRRLSRSTLTGNSLDVSNLVEILTLKDTGTRPNDLGTAVLVSSGEPPSHGGQGALRTAWRRCYLADDWTSFRDAMSDDQLQRRLQSSHLAAVIRTLQANGEDLEKAYIAPGHLLVAPGAPELAARFPELTGTQINELKSAMDRECETLARTIQDTNMLDLIAMLLQ